MNNLSEEMQARLDKWRENPLKVPTAKLLDRPVSRRSGKNDHGDVETLEEWEAECKKSQTRK